jgi:D-alanyl-D-alanine carboxypeptidase (penicillin-binding protein 5/6)
MNGRLIAAVLDCGTDANRFVAMKQILDIGAKLLRYPDAEIADSEFTFSKGAVALLPSQPSMYRKKPLEVLWSKNGDSKGGMASTVKVMNLITGLDVNPNLEAHMTIVSDDLYEGSGNVFRVGDVVKLRDLMWAMMLPSSNSGGRAFAHTIGDMILQEIAPGTYTEEECRLEFISRMNAKAAEIGISNPNFDSTFGGTATITAIEMLRMGIEACTYPDICKIWGYKTHTIHVGGPAARDITLSTTVTDAAIEAEYTILGGKTGSNSMAKALVMAAEVEV